MTAGLFSLAAAGQAAAARSPAQTVQCLRSSGFTVTHRPNLGAASVPARDWFAAKRAGTNVVIAYFADTRGATDARNQLVTVALGSAKAFGIRTSRVAITNVVRTRGLTLYFWPSEKPIGVAAVESCL